MMKVCIFNGDMSRGGGTERITQILANGLVKNPDYKVRVLNLNNASGMSYFPLEAGVGFDILQGQSLPQKIWALWRYVRRENIDVLINVDVMLGIFSLPSALFSRRLKVIAWEMFNLRNDIGSRHTELIRKLSLSLCACYVTQTQGDMEAFQQEMPVHCPITWIHNPCTMTCDVPYNDSSKQLMTAGHFFYTKGYDLAVQVAAKVLPKHPDWTWAFYGDGQRMEETREMVRQAGLENQIIFAGRTKEIQQAYCRSALYVMTSRTEGFGLVLVEAKCCHLPTLAFDVEFGPREIIENGVSGWLVPAFDVDAMAAKIDELITDDEKRRLFAAHAKDNMDQFAPECFLTRWEEVLKTVGTRRK